MTDWTDIDGKDEHGRTVLHWASFNGHVDVVETLLTDWANANAKDEWGQTALHWASFAFSNRSLYVFLEPQRWQLRWIHDPTFFVFLIAFIVFVAFAVLAVFLAVTA